MKKPKWKAVLYLYLFNLVVSGIPLYFFLDLDELEIDMQFRFLGIICWLLALYTVQELKFDEVKEQIEELKNKKYDK